MDERWAGRGWLRPGLLMVEGVVGLARPHSHHTVQVITGAAGIEIGDGQGGRVECMAAVIPPDTVHEVVRGAAAGRIVHFDPESVAGARLLAMISRADGVGGWVRAGGELCSDAEWFAGVERSATELAGRDRHPAVTTVLTLLPGRLEAGPVRLGELAREAGISEGRLAHVFSADMGLPFRPYVRWLRMRLAIRFLAEGHSLTAAAHGAGFADSAHLTRVCRGMFGGPPSEFGWIAWDVSRGWT